MPSSPSARRAGLLVLLLALTVPTARAASTEGAKATAGSAAHDVGNGAADAAHHAGPALQDTGHAIMHGAAAAGHAIVNGAHDVGTGLRGLPSAIHDAFHRPGTGG